MKTIVFTVFVTLFISALGLYAFAVSGAYDVAADRPHIAWMRSILQTVRTHSIAKRAGDIAVPALNTSERLAEGAEHYSAMCTGCHLAPGMSDTELRQGLLPKPPDFSRHEVSAAEAFWVIKHGIKATAMPAWGKSHDDEAIWNLVAFVRQLPHMTPEAYRAATVRTEHESTATDAAHSHEHMHADEHSHDDHDH